MKSVSQSRLGLSLFNGTALEPAATTTDFPSPRDSRWLLIERATVAVAIASLGIRISFGPNVTVGFVVAAVLSPAWFPALRLFRGARFLFGSAALAIISGVVLANIAKADHRVPQNEQLNTIVLLLTALGGIGLVLWGRQILSPIHIGLSYGAGLLVNATMNEGPLTASNPLKFAWAIPVSVFVLAMVNNPLLLKRQLATIIVLCAALTAVDARSLFSTCLLALVLVAWQLRPTSMSRRASWIWTASLMAMLGGAIYFIGTTLLVNGFLGADAQMRSIQQIQTSGSLLLGGRPELAATVALFMYKPWGFGAGVIANPNDILVAKSGMWSINYDPDNGYVDKFMFGSKIELHSGLGDLWASFGIPGVILSLTIIFLVVRSIASLVSSRTASGLVLLLGWWTLWNMFFSPIYSTIPTLMLAMGLLLLPQPDKASTPNTVGPPEGGGPTEGNSRLLPSSPRNGTSGLVTPLRFSHRPSPHGR